MVFIYTLKITLIIFITRLPIFTSPPPPLAAHETSLQLQSPPSSRHASLALSLILYIFNLIRRPHRIACISIHRVQTKYLSAGSHRRHTKHKSREKKIKLKFYANIFPYLEASLLPPSAVCESSYCFLMESQILIIPLAPHSR